MIPETGFMTNPVIPLSPPKKKPGNPSFSAPLTGWVMSPVIPFENPLKILFAPCLRPYPTCSVLSFLIFSLFF